MFTVAVFNPQAAVGKTTLCANLGHALAMRGHQVTLVDFDPAGDLCQYLGLFRPPTMGVGDAMREGAGLEGVLLSTRDELHLVPAGSRLGELDSPQGGAEQGSMLQQVLAQGLPGQDCLLIDCPSTGDILLANALLAVDLALIPVTQDEAGETALPGLIDTIEKFNGARARPLDYRFVINRMPVRRRLTGAAARFCSIAPERFMSHAICQTEIIAESRKMGRTVFEYRPNSRASSDFDQLAKEWLASDFSATGINPKASTGEVSE